MVFQVELANGLGGVTEDNNTGIWSDRTGTLAPVAREGITGSLGPALGGGQVYRSFDELELSRSGHMAFIGYLKVGTGGVTSDNAVVIMSDQSGTLAPVARTGVTGPLGPGLGGGEVFTSLRNISINSSGQIVFNAYVSTWNRQGLWATDINGELKPIVLQHSLFDVGHPSDGLDLRWIRGISYRNSISDDGIVPFELSFTDGPGGIFTAQVPEPGTIALLGLGLAGLLRRPRRRNKVHQVAIRHCQM